MATEFPKFLAWSRAFIAKHSRDLWREVLENRRSNDKLERCDCEDAIVVPERADRRFREGHGCHDCEKCQDCCSCTTCEDCGRVCNDEYCGHCNKCDNCCECRFCQSCSRECSETYCGECEQCQRCCDCSHCSSCDSTYTSGNGDFCGDCDRCGDCCECSESERKVELFECAPKFHAASIGQHKRNPSKRFIAAEIEVADIDGGYETEDAVRQWRGSIVEDGSLPDSGFEINTSPASGDLFVQQVEEICTALRHGGATVNVDCGLHVHVDARDYGYYDVQKLVRVYAKIEEALFDMCSPSRRESTYCKPCGQHYLEILGRDRLPPKVVKERVIKSVYALSGLSSDKGKRFKAIKQERRPEARYYALNLHSWFYRGTIECRMFNGTVAAHKIVSWGMLWARILDYAASHTDAEIDAEIKYASPHSALLRVAGLSSLHEFIHGRWSVHRKVISEAA